MTPEEYLQRVRALIPAIRERALPAERLRPEHVLSAVGEVVRRAPENVNPNIPTGEIEVQVAEVTQLAEAETPPFPIDEDTPVDEMLRLRHRMLDLRREGMRDALVMRDAVIRTMRETLAAEDFLEIEIIETSGRRGG